jgi:hypothetical protein
MKKTSLFISLFVASLFVCSSAMAQERHEEHHQERHEEEHHREVTRRPAPSQFQAHPPGMHPHGPTVHQHQVRVLAPRVVVRGRSSWHHWRHPEFSRPVYYWNWSLIHSVSCTAEDSYGDQYPVTETTGPGFGLENMTAVEDDALDRCYSESGQDQSCYLATCSHF